MSENKVKYRFVTWDDVVDHCKVIAKNLRKLPKFDIIVPVSRGGLTPGVILSEMLDIDEFRPITLQTRKNNHNDYSNDWLDICSQPNRRILVVDDILDSGRTIEILQLATKHPTSHIVYSTLIQNGDAKVSFLLELVYSSLYFHRSTTPDWFVFPWEKEAYDIC